MIYGVTGPASITEAEEEIVGFILQGIATDAEEVWTGGAPGVDTAAARIIFSLFPRSRVILPGRPATFNEEALRFADVVDRLPDEKDRATAFMARNDVLAQADELLAFPRRRTFYRSGTWATINRARKRGKPVWLFPLEEHGAT